MSEITEEQALNRLRSLITYETNIKMLAASFGVSIQFMSAVLAGKKPMNSAMQAEIGVNRRIIYSDLTEARFRQVAEAVREEAAKACNDRGVQEQEDYGLGRETQNFYRARDIIRNIDLDPIVRKFTETDQ